MDKKFIVPLKCQGHDPHFRLVTQSTGDCAWLGDLMTNPNYTHVTLVVDRSGSMSSMRVEAQDGINLLLREQFMEEGEVSFTVVDFDTEIVEVESMRREAFEYQLEPRGSTALLDATAHAILKTGEDLAALEEDKRPGKVLFVVITDGQENASRRFELPAVQEMIARQTNEYRWNFQYIGTEANAWEGARLGMRTSSHSGRGKGMSASYKEMNESLKSFRKPDFEEDFFMAEMIADDED